MDKILPQKFYDFGFKDSDFIPSEKIRSNASLGLELRKAAPKSRKGGLTNVQASKFGIGSGVQRAVTLINDQFINPKTVKRMYSFFSRHSVHRDKHDHKNPNRSYISWLIWGGDEAFDWARDLVNRMKDMEEKIKKKKTISEHIEDLVEKYLFEDFNHIKSEKNLFQKIQKIQTEI